MARNDAVLIDGIIDERVEQGIPSSDRGEAFELFSIEQILKDHDLSRDEVQSGLIDGRGDGGIDAIYILVNGHLLDDDSFSWPKSHAEIQLYLVSCKHHDTFKQATLDSMIATVTELFDFGVHESDLKGSYSEELLSARQRLERAYRKLSPRLTGFTCAVVYASRGDTQALGVEVVARSEQIKGVLADQFANATATFSFVGSEELLKLHRRQPAHSLELPFRAQLSKGERYVVLVSLPSYFEFVTEEGKLRRYLFDSNVRDFMGLNRTNEDIRKTLSGSANPDFWWLNNGVTILATSASIVGNSIQVENVQIVNGLQTTESIYRHFREGVAGDDDRCVLVKIIVSNDGSTRDSIIRATNNQTSVEPTSLHATDKIQRDIEDAFRNHALVYERRKNYYLNEGVHSARIVTPLYLASGSVALLMKQAWLAPKLRSRTIRSDAAYEKVFDTRIPLETWPSIASIFKFVDSELEIFRPNEGGTENFLKKRRSLVALLLVARRAKTFVFGPRQITEVANSVIDGDEVKRVYQSIVDAGFDRRSARPEIWSSRKMILAFAAEFAEENGIANVQTLSTNGFGIGAPPPNDRAAVDVTPEFVEQVRLLLPPQPWKPGMHRQMCDLLDCASSSLGAAIDQLVERGTLYRQRRGILYDSSGAIVLIDTDRVDPKTLELK